jgi:integrase
MASKKGTGSVYQDARGYWNAAIELPPKFNGDRRRKVIRRKRKQDALAAMRKFQAELAKNGDVRLGSKSVEQWFAHWLDNIVAKHSRPNTVKAYRAAARTQILPVIGKVRMDKVTPAHVRSVLMSMDARGLSSTTAKQTHGIMSSAFEEAVRDGEIPMNPAKNVRTPPRAVRDLEVLTLEEAIRLLQVAALDPAYGARWATALLTGARRGEVLGLTEDRVTDVLDFSKQLQVMRDVKAPGIPNVPADYDYQHLLGSYYLTPPKTRSGRRVIPMFEPLRSILERHMSYSAPNPWGLVFTIDGKPVSERRDAVLFERLLADAGIDKKVRIHGLRHTAVDLLYAAGVPEDLLVQIVGHSTRAMTRSYKSNGTDRRLQDAMTRFGSMFTLPAGADSETSA